MFNPENKQLACSHEMPDYIEDMVVANYYDGKFPNYDSPTYLGPWLILSKITPFWYVKQRTLVDACLGKHLPDYTKPLLRIFLHRLRWENFRLHQVMFASQGKDKKLVSLDLQ